jgi:hypothetical protein
MNCSPERSGGDWLGFMSQKPRLLGGVLHFEVFNLLADENGDRFDKTPRLMRDNWETQYKRIFEKINLLVMTGIFSVEYRRSVNGAANHLENGHSSSLKTPTFKGGTELLSRFEYLDSENRILRSQRAHLAYGRRAKDTGRNWKPVREKALEEIVTIMKPETPLAWHCQLIWRKFDSSKIKLPLVDRGQKKRFCRKVSDCFKNAFVVASVGSNKQYFWSPHTQF